MLQSFGADLFGERFGHERPVVLALPGWMRTRSDFRYVLDGLDAVALDLPGFGGATPEPATPMGAAGYADAVLPVLDQLAAEGPVVVLGHSFGGRVAVHLAQRRPAAMRGLVLTGVPLLARDDRPAPTASVAHRLARWANQVGLLSDQRMEARRRSSGSADYRNASGVMRGVLVTVVQETYEAQLEAICGAGLPTALVWGSADPDVPVRTAERAGALIGPLAHVTVLDGIGHLTPLEAPEALRRAVVGLLA